MAMLGARTALRTKPIETAPDERPAALASAPGAVYRVDEPVVDTLSLVRAFASIHDRRMVAAEGVDAVTLTAPTRRGAPFEVACGPSGARVLEADAVVLAAGSWSSLVPGWPSALPEVRPVKGHMALLEERPPRVRSILAGRGGYVVPRGDGRVVCGSTMEHVGHRREVTADGVRAVLGKACALAPGLGEAELVRVWCNFRPYSGDGPPLVGASPVPGLFLATGHHRNGILLGPETAELVRDAIFSAA